MIGICFLTCLTFFPASCHLIGDVGPPPELMAGDTGEGNEGYLFGDVKKCELQSENLAVELNPKETHTFDLTLRIDGQMLPSHLVKYETVIGPEISLLGQHLTCTAGIGKVVERFQDAVADIEGVVISTMHDGKLVRFFVLGWLYMGKSYALEPRASELTSCRDKEGPAKSLLKGTFLLHGQEHYLFEVTNSRVNGSSATPLPSSQTVSTTTPLPSSQTVSTTTPLPSSQTVSTTTPLPSSQTVSTTTPLPSSQTVSTTTPLPSSQTVSTTTPLPSSQIANTTTPSRMTTPSRTTSTNRPSVNPPPNFIILCAVEASGCLVVIALVLCSREECKKTLCGEKKSKEAKKNPMKQ